MRRLLPLLTLLLLAPPLSAQSIKLPATLVVPGPGLVVVVPDSVDADDVAWVSMDDGLQLIPTSLLKDSKTACGVALKEKTYRVRAIATKAKDGHATFSPWSECVVTVGTPGPTPGPPGPVPPAPDDPLVKAIQDAYRLDPDPNKANNVKQLAKVYRAAATVTGAGSGGVNDPQLTSYSQLLAKMHNAAGGLGVPEAGIPKVRAAVRTYLDVVLGVGTAASAARSIDRPLATAEIGRMAAALEVIK